MRRRTQLGQSCVLAFSGLRAVHRQRLREIGVPTRFVFLHGPPSVIAARLAQRRGHFMPVQLSDRQFEALELPTAEPGVIWADVSCSPTKVLDTAFAAIEGT